MSEVTFSECRPGGSGPRSQTSAPAVPHPRVLRSRVRGTHRYGYVGRDGVELHLSESPEHDRHDGAELFFYVSDADATMPGPLRA
jgi:hypothetical protein